MTAVLAGTLTERVFLLRRDAVRDDLGGADGGWSAVASVWAALAPEGPGTAGEGDRRFGGARWRATLRSAVSLFAGDRLQWRGLLFEVLVVTADPATPDRIILKLEEMR